jgi:hypothetical protein
MLSRLDRPNGVLVAPLFRQPPTGPILVGHKLFAVCRKNGIVIPNYQLSRCKMDAPHQ